jgi:hypothetical protein
LPLPTWGKNTAMIAPIETRYKGCRFRSRLEARWAVFFDEAKLTWQYEPQGFTVNGLAYLPDFFLPQLDCYFEVKGSGDYDDALLRNFADQAGKSLVLAIGDIPDPATVEDPEKYEGFQVYQPKSLTKDDFDLVWGFNDMFLKCDGCGRIQLMNQSYISLKSGCCEGDRLSALSRAFVRARAARFEHGESG